MSKKIDWYLSISPEEFDIIYKDTHMIKYKNLFHSEPETDEEYIMIYLTNKLWRLNNIYTIRDKEGNIIKLNMKRAQHISYAESLIHYREIILKSRQLGISTFWLMSFFDDAIFLDNMSCGLMAQDADAAKDLLTKVNLAWEDLDDSIKRFLNIKRVINNSKVTEFSNGSQMKVRTSFRSGTLTRLHISELGKIAAKNPEKASETNSGSLQAIKAGNIVIIESTAEGRDNMFGKKWDDSIENVKKVGKKGLNELQFNPIFFSWIDDIDCTLDTYTELSKDTKKYIELVERRTKRTLTDKQKWWAETKRQELGELFDREFPFDPESAFSQARDGSYYGEYFKELRDSERLIEFDEVYSKVLPVEVSFDLGINDTFVMTFFQASRNMDGKLEVRLIDAYYNSGESLAHYVKVLRDKEKELGYKYSKFILPHDARKRELGSAKSIAGQLRDLGLNKQVILPLTSVLDGIQAVRAMIPVLWINKDLDYMIKAFENYTKEWNSVLKVWKDKPKHDEWSNPMDAVRYFAMYKVNLLLRGYKGNRSFRNKRGMSM